MNNLNIEDIHKIREEHAVLTRDMAFDEYKAELNNDIKSLLSTLKSMKSKRPYSFEREMLNVAEPPAEYKTKSKSKHKI